MLTYSQRKQLALSFASKLVEILLVEKIYLFGSTARGDDHLYSDLDIAMVVPKKISYKIREKINDLVVNILLNHGLVVNWIAFDEDEWQTKSLPVILTIKHEGELLWEKKKQITTSP